VLTIAAEQRLSITMVRVADGALIVIAVAFAAIVWYSGALAPGSNVAQASRRQFLFVRCAFAWLLVAAALSGWYGVRSFADGRLPDQFEVDAIRHVLTVGVVTTLIIGMAMLIVPEFAGRRLQHPREGSLVLAMIIALAVATVLRVWPPMEGISGRWRSPGRWRSAR
jgi:hypothetical protein